MKLLGLFGPGPNPSAALLDDGKLVAFVEEERLNRIKTSPNSLPIQAARQCLSMAGLSLDDIGGIGYAWDCENYNREMPAFFSAQNRKYSNQDQYNRLQDESLLNLYHPARIERGLQLGLGSLSKSRKLPKVTYFPHHLCHAASAYYCSGFEEANVLSIDGSGEDTTTLLCVGKQDRLDKLDSFQLPDTLGGFYATFTEFIGFRPYMDEGKLMGLASYGEYSEELQTKLDKFLPFDRVTGDFTIDPNLRYYSEHHDGSRFTDEFVELFGKPRDRSVSALEAPYPDLAFAAQWRLEQIVIRLAEQMYQKTGLRKICLAGGVAMNCVMNGKLAEQEFIDDIYVQPAASDNGSALGAALLLAREKGDSVNHRVDHMFWGPSYSAAEIEQAFKESKIDYYRSDNIEVETAKLLSEGKIIGWFQGAMEVGARALGNRSILASPLLPEMKEKLNLEVKHREKWRPFCPSMCSEDYYEYIDAEHDSPFMIMAFPVKEKYKEIFPSCVHVDGTARPQTVSKEHNPRYWNLIREFKKITGYGIVINTSFNIQGEPLVCRPTDALRTFGGTGIDYLMMGDFIAKKAGPSGS
jgi:carbamoyltransferase